MESQEGFGFLSKKLGIIQIGFFSHKNQGFCKKMIFWKMIKFHQIKV